MPKDYYETLGVDRSASADEIKRSYRKLAHQYRPDKGGDQERFKEINEAYQVLRDPEKRRQYDQFGQTFDGAGFNQGGHGPFSGGFGSPFEDMGDVHDIFSQFFGGSRGRTRRRSRGLDLGIEIDVPFEEMVFGKKREFSLTRQRTCQRCHGNRAEPGTKIKRCDTCNGAGVVQRQAQTILGSFVQQTICPDCRGEGKLPEERCTECRGEGRTRQTETLLVAIPAGIEHGTRIRIRGEGEVSAEGGDPGDLYVLVRVKPHSLFRRDGMDIVSTQHIPFSTAALGGEVAVETVGGEKEVLSVPPGTQSGTELTIPHKGIASQGNHRVIITIEVPKRLSRKQKDLLREFEETGKKKSGLGKLLGIDR